MRKLTLLALLFLLPNAFAASNPIGRGYFLTITSARYTPAIQLGHLGPGVNLESREAAWSQNGTNLTVAGSFIMRTVEYQQSVQVRVFMELPIAGTADLCSGSVTVATTAASETGVVYGSPNGDNMGAYNPPLGPNTVAVDFAPQVVGSRTYFYQYTCDVNH